MRQIFPIVWTAKKKIGLFNHHQDMHPDSFTLYSWEALGAPPPKMPGESLERQAAALVGH